MARLKAGNFMSSLSLRADKFEQAGLKAGEQEPVELLVVEGTEFQRWLDQNPANRATLEGAEWRPAPALAEGASHDSMEWQV